MMQQGDIPLCVPEMGGNEMDYVDRAIRRNEVAQGDYLPRFEAAVAEYVGVHYAVAVSSGTAALHLALLAAGVGPGDEVIMPTLTFIATANAVRYCGATPVFVDVEPEHWTMDPMQVQFELERASAVARAYQDRRLKVILPVHLLGHPADMDPLIDLAASDGLRVVEDVTEALGAGYSGRDYHDIPTIGCLSFNGNKLITTGGGGMVLTDNADLAARVRYLANQAKDDPAEGVHRAVGYNYRMSNIAAAVGCAQMERIEDFLAAKRRIAETYSRELAGVPGIVLPTEAPWAKSAWWLYTIRVQQAEYGMDAQCFLKRLAAAGIETRLLWTPLHLLLDEAGNQLFPNDAVCPVAELAAKEGLSLPSSVGLTESQQARVIEAIRDRG